MPETPSFAPNSQMPRGRSPRVRSGRVLAAVSVTGGLLVGALMVPPSAGASRAATPLWQSVSGPKTLFPASMCLLTNGSVMVQQNGSQSSGGSGWWLLTPSSTGSYVHGSWRAAAPFPAGYAPLDDATAVLPDGRLIVEGGEYNGTPNSTLTNRGAIYTPVANIWKSVAPPPGAQWSNIGDAPSVVLADGTFMLGGSGNYTDSAQALLNPTTLTWSATGTGKVDGNEEEGFTLLPNDDVLTVGLEPTLEASSLYDPVTGSWSSAGSVPVPVVTATGTEMGPQVLRPTGTVLVVGSTTGENAIYHVASGTWSAGPSFPLVNGLQPGEADGPAAVLPDGDVLLAASPGLYKPPTSFFVFDGSTISQIPSAPGFSSVGSDVSTMLLLPTGQVLVDNGSGELEMYNGGGVAKAAWRPTISSVAKVVTRGGTYAIAGTQLNGLTEGDAFGDERQCPTNYPLVRLTYRHGHRVVYARTFGMTSMAVTPGLASRAKFQLPKSAPSGAATLTVVADGISSLPVRVKVVR